MADPNISIAKTIAHEGGFSNNPADSGGATKYGVEQRDVPSIPIQTLTVAQATAYYLANYVKPLFHEINSQAILDKLVDAGVLFGVGAAVSDLQRAIPIYVDGLFGAETLLLVNEAPEAQLLADFKTQLFTRAHGVVAAHPQDLEFLVGWLNRISS